MTETAMCGPNCKPPDQHTNDYDCIVGKTITVINDQGAAKTPPPEEEPQPDTHEDEWQQVCKLVKDNMPWMAFHDSDMTGDTWEWTTPNGKLRLIMASLPRAAIVLEFKYKQRQKDHAQVVVTVMSPTLADVNRYIIPLLAHLQ